MSISLKPQAFVVVLLPWALDSSCPLLVCIIRLEILFKTQRAFRQALDLFNRRVASFRRLFVRRFVVLPLFRFVVRCFVLVPSVSLRRPVVLSFVVSVSGRFVGGL